MSTRPPGSTCSAPWAKRNADCLTSCARSTAPWAMAPSASTTAACGRPASSAARYSLQVAISAGVGLLSGGTHFTALVMRAPVSTQAVDARRRHRRGRPAERVQRLVQQHARVVARERTTRRIGAVESGREADDQQSRRGIAERRDRRTVVRRVPRLALLEEIRRGAGSAGSPGRTQSSHVPADGVAFGLQGRRSCRSASRDLVSGPTLARGLNGARG